MSGGVYVPSACAGRGGGCGGRGECDWGECEGGLTGGGVIVAGEVLGGGGVPLEDLEAELAREDAHGGGLGGARGPSEGEDALRRWLGSFICKGKRERNKKENHSEDKEGIRGIL